MLYNGMPGEHSGLSDGSVIGDWRLPSKSEVVEITVGDEHIRYNQMHFFTNVNADLYWSSTTNPYVTYEQCMDRVEVEWQRDRLRA